MMNRFMIFAAIMTGFLIFVKLCWAWYFRQLRQKGLYPQKGKATLFDVRRLLMNDQKEAAVRLYSEIFRTNAREARRAVEELEKSLKT